MRLQVVNVVKSSDMPKGGHVTKVVCDWMPFAEQGTRRVQRGLVTIFSDAPLYLKTTEELVGTLYFDAFQFEDKFINSIVLELDNGNDKTAEV